MHPSQRPCAGSQSYAPASCLAGCTGPDRTMRKLDGRMCCPLLSSTRVLNVLSYGFVTSPNKLNPNVFNNANYSKRMSCLIAVKKKELHKDRRVEMMMLRMTGQKGVHTFSLPWSQGSLWIFHVVIPCSHPSSSAWLFLDEFIEKQSGKV